MSYDYSGNILVQESAGNLLQDELDIGDKVANYTEVPFCRHFIPQRSEIMEVFI